MPPQPITSASRPGEAGAVCRLGEASHADHVGVTSTSRMRHTVSAPLRGPTMTRTDLDASHPIDLHLDIRALMQDALAMADCADAVALAGFFSHFEVTTKADGTDVTSVDRQIEAELRDMIGHGNTAPGVLGEEYGETTAGPEGVGRWVLDPIDGTAAFIDADPRFATLIAFESEGRPLVGVVSAPALGLRWWAGIGHGAFLSRDGAVSAARVSITDDPSAARGLVPDSWMNGPGPGEWPRSPDVRPPTRWPRCGGQGSMHRGRRCASRAGTTKCR